jgi:hypothetical protein
VGNRMSAFGGQEPKVLSAPIRAIRGGLPFDFPARGTTGSPRPERGREARKVWHFVANCGIQSKDGSRERAKLAKNRGKELEVRSQKSAIRPMSFRWMR